MLSKLERLWRGVRWTILGRQSTLGEQEKSSGARRRAMIFSLAASLMIWLMLSLSENYYLSVEYMTCVSQAEEISSPCVSGMDEDSALVQPLPEAIRATLYGPGLNLLVQRFRARYWNSPITFDSDQGVVDTQLLLRIPEEVSIESIIPERIDFQKEARSELLVPIESRIRFVPQPPHFFVGKPQLDPDSVWVSGPVSVMNQLLSWPTKPDTVVATGDSVRFQIDLADSLAGLVSLRTNNTTVIRSSPQFTEGQREQVRVEIEGIPNANSVVQLDPESVTITYQIPLSRFLEAQQSQLIRAIISYSEIYDDTTGRVEPTVEYPEEFMLRQVTVSPERLRYFINIGSQ
ncbi:MAG: hypothetical protein OXH01_07525 [Bacteroidetes bacterium]|nr:hypothetical protein [Bacteroidota bacterium]